MIELDLLYNRYQSFNNYLNFCIIFLYMNKMNKNIKARERQETSKINLTKTIPNIKNNKSEPVSPCEQKKFQLNLKNIKLHTTTRIMSTPSVSKLCSPRQKESDKIVFEAKHHPYLYIAIGEFEKGVRIILTVQSTHNQTTVISCTYSTIEIEKAKVKHSFPMPLLFNSTRLIKIIFTTFFYQEQFSILVQSIKGKIKQKNVVLESPIQQDTCNYHIFGVVVQIDPFRLIEQAQNIRRKKFNSTQRGINLTSSKSTTYLQTTGRPRRTQIQISKLENEKSVRNLFQQKKITNFMESVLKYKNNMIADTHTPIIQQIQAENFRGQEIVQNKIKFPFKEDIVKRNHKIKEQQLKKLEIESCTMKRKENQKNLINKQKSPTSTIFLKSHKNSRATLSELADPKDRKKFSQKRIIQLRKIEQIKTSQTMVKKIIPRSLNYE